MGWLLIGGLAAGCVVLAPLLYFAWMHGGVYRKGNADALIILGYKCDQDRIHPLLKDRLDTALRLWSKFRFQKILLSGGAVTSSLSEAEIMKRYLEENGVPADKLLLETVSRNTVHNLVNCRVIMEQEGLASCVILSNSFHIRRIRYIASCIGMPAMCFGSRSLSALRYQIKLTYDEIKAFRLTLPWIRRAQQTKPGEMMGQLTQEQRVVSKGA
ncbi:hypothetical protein J31TS4_41820 [Paenibacillus sp. J31TS4]|nr:hypothetical protein J31TS4_41820 [Paenibacillus sp. J31TS4]